jgi:hypothetical protein
MVFDKNSVVIEELGAYLLPNPILAKYFQVRTNQDGSLNKEDLGKAAEG